MNINGSGLNSYASSMSSFNKMAQIDKGVKTNSQETTNNKETTNKSSGVELTISPEAREALANGSKMFETKPNANFDTEADIFNAETDEETIIDTEADENVTIGTTTNASTVTTNEEDNTVKLSSEEIAAMKAQQDEALANTLAKMAEQVINNQSGLSSGSISLKLASSNFYDLPPLATTPEEAAAAIAPGGAYSVEAVSDRIFEFAETLAGGNPELMEEMRGYVQQAFKEVGMDLETGKGMPDITFETYNHLMERFDNYASTNA